MRTRRHWRSCPHCHMMVFGEKHDCPEKIKAKTEAQIDMVMDIELSTWNQDLKKFWKSKDTKFTQYLIKHNKI